MAGARSSAAMASALAAALVPLPRRAKSLLAPLGGAESTRRFSSTSSSPAVRNPIIIGGGIAGLATAAALQNIAGVSGFTVLEQSPPGAFYRAEGVGAGAQLGPNGLRALRAIGGDALVQRLMASGSKLEGTSMVMPGNSFVVPDTTEKDSHDGLPQVFVRWSALRQMLREMIPEGSIMTGVGEDIVGYTVNESDGSVTLLSRDGRSDILPAASAASSLVVGADGAASTCRYWVQSGNTHIPHGCDGSHHHGLRDTGRVNIKAVVPRPLPDFSLKPGLQHVYFAADGGVGCFAGPAGDGHTYWAISIADEKKDDGTVAPFLSGVGGGASDGAVYLKEVKSALLSKFADLGTDDCKFAADMVDITDPDTIYVTRSREAETIGPSLASSDGKIVLVGDAAHAMSGSYGQNPNLALEGAAELAACIKKHAGGGAGAALEEYSSMRVGRCTEMQRRSAERAERAMRGEKNLEDVSKWIFQWDLRV